MQADPNVEIQIGRERIPVRARIADGEESIANDEGVTVHRRCLEEDDSA